MTRQVRKRPPLASPCGTGGRDRHWQVVVGGDAPDDDDALLVGVASEALPLPPPPAR